MKFKALCIIPHAGEIEIKPLVMCKECKHASTFNGVYSWCDKITDTEGYLICFDRRGDFFCAYGEKGKPTHVCPKRAVKGEDDDG